MSKLSLVKKVISAFRPKTLTAALVPCVAGSALAFSDFHQVDYQVLFFALLSSFCIQIGTNLVNDSVDFKKGADTPERIGPERITASGILSSKMVMLIATIFFMTAVGLGIPLVIKGGLPIVVLGLVSVLMGYAYTAGPYPLAYRGLGDLFVLLFFGLIAVGGIYYLNTFQISLAAIVLGLQVGLHAAVLIAINNLRDIDGDKKVQKNTLAVRLGISKTRILIACYVLLPFLLGIYWVFSGKKFVMILSMLCLPLAVKLLMDLFRNDPGPIYNQFLARSAGLHLIFGLLLSIGLLI